MAAPRRSSGRTRRRLRRLAFVFALLLVVEYLVLPQVTGARQALHLLGRVNLWLVLLGVALEVGALVAYAMLTAAVLPRERRPGLFSVLRIDLSTLAVSHVVPGGSAVSTGVGYRLLVEQGLEPGDVGFALAAQGLGSAVVLNVLLWVALVVSIPFHGFNPLYVTAAVVGVVLIGLFSAAVLMLTRGEARSAKVVRTVARRVPFLDENRLHRLIHRLAARLRTLAADRSLLLRAVAWAAANWVLDAASLWVFLAAFGARTNPDTLLVAYGLANVLAAIPFTPGGLGVVEAVLTSSLVGFGLTRGVAILGVIAWRLVNFWLPIPVGGLAYLSLKVGRAAPRERKARELTDLVGQAARVAEDPKTWAERHALRLAAGTPEREG